MISLKGFIQNYSWGKYGKASQVALLCQGKDEFEISDGTPYAELWMGTHEKGPTKILDSKKLLSDWLFENGSLIGEKLLSAMKIEAKTLKSFQLPFLFKVLSINEALSIQVHPNKDQAKILHAKDAKNYPDDNHKPEIAIALTPFEVLCGFRPAEEILNFIEQTPELQRLISDQSLADFRQCAKISPENSKPKIALKACFSDLMRQTKDNIDANLKQLAERFSKLAKSAQPVELLQRLQKRYPGDVGCFSVFFLNYITLQPGEAVFLGPNEPHAYLSGDCIECMACSDNTIRAGLTPKYKDVNNLLEMLTYSMQSGEKIKFAPKKLDENVTVYRPPVPEFVVHKIEVSDVAKLYELVKLEVCSLLICIMGKAKTIGDFSKPQNLLSGDIFFVPANQTFKFEVSDRLLLFRAFCDQL